MINELKIVCVVVASVAVFGCKANENEAPKASEKTAQTAAESKQGATFLKALQASDKKLLYEVSKLAPADVEESRTKLTNVKKYKLTAEQRTETEHALRMSGSIDFYLKKITPLLKGADIKITGSSKTEPPRIPMIVHAVKLTYKDKSKAPMDAGGRHIEELAFRLQQMNHKVQNKELLEFMIDNNDFIDIMDRNYRVK